MGSKTSLLLLGVTLCLIACKKEETKTELIQNDSVSFSNKITFKDFKKIKGVANVNDVPFTLHTDLDSVHFFVSPDLNAANLKVLNDKFDNHYGFEEKDDFYSIHYSIGGVLDNSIEVFVLKTEFVKASDLMFKGENLNEIRSSDYQSKNDIENKSFAKFGNVTEITEAEYKKAQHLKTTESFVKNADMKLDGAFWTNPKTGFKKAKIVESEEGEITYDYIGFSKSFGSELFLEDYMSDQFYIFYNSETAEPMKRVSSFFPHILSTSPFILELVNNFDVGSDLIVKQFDKEAKTIHDILYVNFTNFKIANSKEVFWTDKNTIYAEVFPINSKEEQGRQHKSYVKIVLSDNVL